MGRFHRTDATPNIVYTRRSLDMGETWGPVTPILADPKNLTMYGGVPVVDDETGMVHFVHNAVNWGKRDCSGCELKITSSADDGASWSSPVPLNTTGPANTTWGGGLASGIMLTTGPHAGRLLVALRHDCGCSTNKASFVVYSDDHGRTWAGGQPMELLPQYGGGWTECEVAELKNGSVLMTSRNFYGRNSGQGPRLFARSDDGGASWAANWSAGVELPDPYCEGSILSDPTVEDGAVFFGNPSSHGRYNMSVHVSRDGGRSWPQSVVVYPGGSAYSDMAFTRNKTAVAVLFEKDNYNTVAFGILPLPLPTAP
eukprot:g4166.t1